MKSSIYATLSLFLVACGSSTDGNGSGFETAASASASDGSASDGSASASGGDTDSSGSASDSDSDGSASDGTTTDDSAGGTTDDSGGGFVPTPDAFNPSACDPWAQDCPDGEKCVPYKSPNGSTWDANKCVPVVDSPASPGDPCTVMGNQTGEDNCDATSTCNWVVDGEGICVEMCTGNANAPVCNTPMTSCNIDNDGTRNLCNPLCDPILQDCPDNSRMTCLVANGSDTFNCELGWGEDGLGVGEECFFDNSCLNGNLCIYNADAVPGCTGGGCCAPYCDLTTPQCPDASTECVPFYEDGTAPPMYTHVGVCLIPGV